MEKSRKHDTWAEKVKATQTEKSSPSSARREQGRPGPERLQDGALSQGDLTQVTQSQAWSIGMIGENVLGRRPHAGKGGGTADGSPTTLPANQETLGEKNSFQTKSVFLFSDCYRRSSEDYQGQHSWTADMGVWLEAGQVEAGSTVTGGEWWNRWDKDSTIIWKYKSGESSCTPSMSFFNNLDWDTRKVCLETQRMSPRWEEVGGECLEGGRARGLSTWVRWGCSEQQAPCLDPPSESLALPATCTRQDRQQWDGKGSPCGVWPMRPVGERPWAAPSGRFWRQQMGFQDGWQTDCGKREEAKGTPRFGLSHCDDRGVISLDREGGGGTGSSASLCSLVSEAT